MDAVESPIARKGIDKILQTIKKSNLSEKVVSDASKVIEDGTRGIARMFESLPFKAPSAYEGWCDEIACHTMGLISPVLRGAQVPVEQGQHLYRAIYQAARHT